MSDLAPLKYLSSKAVKILSESLENNLDRYREGGFEDLISQQGWVREDSQVMIDHGLLSTIDSEGNRKAFSKEDRRNATIVFKAMRGMTPRIARDERVWVMLCHADCIEYARKRWLGPYDISVAKRAGDNDGKVQDNKLLEHVRRHFFAYSYNVVRDDNALSRLWWSAYAAKVAMPDDWERALEIIFFSADVRSNFIERSLITSRPVLARGIISVLDANRTIVENEAMFRSFMKVLNRRGSGILFEAWTDDAVEKWLLEEVVSSL